MGRTAVAQAAAAAHAIEARQLGQGLVPDLVVDERRPAALRAIAAELGITQKKQLGQLMKVVNERHRGALEGARASKLAGEFLS